MYKRQEYDELAETVGAYQDKFESVQIAAPLLGDVGTDATAVSYTHLPYGLGPHLPFEPFITDRGSFFLLVLQLCFIVDGMLVLLQLCLLYTSRCV